MIEPRQYLGLALKACRPALIANVSIRQDLDGDIALQSRIPPAIDMAHPAGTDESLHLIRSEHLTCKQGSCAFTGTSFPVFGIHSISSQLFVAAILALPRPLPSLLRSRFGRP